MADAAVTEAPAPAPEASPSRSAEAAQASPALTAALVVLRVVCHAIAEVPPFVIIGIQISKGWLPTSDDAVIAWRTWSVFSGPLPLDGQFTQITTAGHHAAFDLGPLQYYLLAIPNRIDPVHGILWGSAIVIAVLVALAIEAAWSAAGPLAGAIAALALALMTGTLVESSVNLAWNPSLGAYAFATTIAAALAVARGRFGWLPVAVATASLAAQSHVSFVLPSLAALVVGLGLGILERRSFPVTAFLTAVAVGVLCFLAPLVQQLRGHPGNWSVVFGNLGHLGKTVGIDTGLRGVGAATALPPSWWVRIPPYSTVASYGTFERILYERPVAWGITALVLAGTVAVAGWLLRRRNIAALSALCAASGIAAAVTLGSVPDGQEPYLVYYLYFCLWPIGMGILVAYGGAVFSAARALVRALVRALASRTAPRTTLRTPPGAHRALTLAATLAGSAALAAAGAGLCVNDEPYGTSALFLMGWQPIQTVHRLLPRALALVRHKEVAGAELPFVVVYRTTIPFVNTDIEDSLAYELVARGVPARVVGPADQPLGPGYAGDRHEARLVIVPGFHGRYTLTWQPRARGGP